MPGDQRRIQAELFGERLHHADTVGAERGERAHRTTELHHRDLAAEPGEAGGMTLQRGEPERALEAEGDRQCVLGVGAPGHRGVPVAARQSLERRLDAPQILPDQLETVAQLQHERGVDDVLGGGPPVHVAAGIARARMAQSLDERHDGIADQLGVLADRRQIEARDVGVGSDLRRRLPPGSGRAAPGRGRAPPRRRACAAAAPRRRTPRASRAS